MVEVCQQEFNCLPVIFGWRRRLHYDILDIIHRDFSCMNVTLYSMIHMLGVLVMRCVLVHSAVVALHLMLHKHNHNKLTTSESNGHNQPTSMKQFSPDYFGRLYPLFTDSSPNIWYCVSVSRFTFLILVEGLYSLSTIWVNFMRTIIQFATLFMLI